MIYSFLLLLILTSTPYANSIELMKDYFDYKDEKPLPTIANDLVYGEGSTEITSQINEYETITANKPIRGSIFVTHLTKDLIDNESFRLGNAPLKVRWVQSTSISSLSSLLVTIYSFQLDGYPIGKHTLPPIHVKVGDQEFQALPLTIEVFK